MYKSRYISERGNERTSRNTYSVEQCCFFNTYHIILPGSIRCGNVRTCKYAASAYYAHPVKTSLVKLDTVHPVDRATSRPSHAIGIIGGGGTDLKGPVRSAVS